MCLPAVTPGAGRVVLCRRHAPRGGPGQALVAPIGPCLESRPRCACGPAALRGLAENLYLEEGHLGGWRSGLWFQSAQCVDLSGIQRAGPVAAGEAQ